MNKYATTDSEQKLKKNKEKHGDILAGDKSARRRRQYHSVFLVEGKRGLVYNGAQRRSGVSKRGRYLALSVG